MALPPWSVDNLESETPKCPLTPSSEHPKRILSGIKVLELCRIIAGPIITRILGEYGADVLKITSPNLSDVPFFQVDGNMGKHAAELDLKSSEGRAEFEKLLAEADVVVDGYRPGALEKLGYGATALTKLAKERGKGFVYVNENCFGYEGEWAGRPGWQQIADCVSALIYSCKGDRTNPIDRSVASRGSRVVSWACQNPSSLLFPFRTTEQDALVPSQPC
jgi:crotonobetainyl-CoA:carnitine CoA-transferase CaiB-like acyl-CoA transferase